MGYFASAADRAEYVAQVNKHSPDASGGRELLEFSVAVNDRVRGEDGNWYDRPNYIDCALWGKRAQALSKIMHKGDKVGVHGSIRYDSWQDSKTGSKRSKLSCSVISVELMSKRSSQESAPAPAAHAPDMYSDENIPF